MDKPPKTLRTWLSAWLDRRGAPLMLVALAVAGAVLTLAVSLTTGRSRQTTGALESVRVPEVIYFATSVHGRVRLADGREVSVALPDVSCRIGDRVVVEEAPTFWGRQFRASICAGRFGAP